MLWRFFFNDLIALIIKSGNKCIRRGKKGKVKVLGWNNGIKELKQKARVHYKAWRSYGKQRCGQLYDCMRESSKLFKLKLKEKAERKRGIL